MDFPKLPQLHITSSYYCNTREIWSFNKHDLDGMLASSNFENGSRQIKSRYGMMIKLAHCKETTHQGNACTPKKKELCCR
jgi:hypothetical protein